MNSNIADALDRLKQRDDETRSKLLREERLHGSYDDEMQQVHINNAQALNELVNEHGWPGISLVGLEGCRAAWMLAQHSICTPALQRKFLQLLKIAADKAEVPMLQVAMLTDRIRFNEDRPQVYGCILDWDENGVLGCRVEDPDSVDARRKSVDLLPLEQTIEAQRLEIAAEGGGPPPDYYAFRSAFLNWAKQTGWQ